MGCVGIRKYFIIYCLVLAGGVWAQDSSLRLLEADQVIVTLKDAVENALENSTQLMQGTIDQAITQRTAQQRWGALLPDASLSGSLDLDLSREDFQSYVLTPKVHVTFEVMNEMAQQWQVLKQKQDMSPFHAALLSSTVERDISLAFYDLLLHYSILRVYKYWVQQALFRFDWVSDPANGIKNAYHLLNARLWLELETTHALRQEIVYDQLQKNMKMIMGVEQNTSEVLVPSGFIDDSGSGFTIMTQSGLQRVKDAWQNIEDNTKTRPDLLLANMQKKLLSLQQGAVLRELIPDISFSYTFAPMFTSSAPLPIATDRSDQKLQVEFVLNLSEYLPSAELFTRHYNLGRRFEQQAIVAEEQLENTAKAIKDYNRIIRSKLASLDTGEKNLMLAMESYDIARSEYYNRAWTLDSLIGIEERIQDMQLEKLYDQVILMKSIILLYYTMNTAYTSPELN